MIGLMKALATTLRALLDEMPGVTVRDLGPDPAAIVTFRLDRMDAASVAATWPTAGSTCRCHRRAARQSTASAVTSQTSFAPPRNLFPIAFSRNVPLDMEKRDCCEVSERPVWGCPADSPDGRQWVASCWAAFRPLRPNRGRSAPSLTFPTSDAHS